MSLKREFIDMLHLLIDSLEECEEYHSYYEIEEDSYRNICMKYDGEDVTYGSFYQCNNDNCMECSECKHIKVDVSLFDGEWTRNYFFGNKPDVKGVIPIKNRKQLLSEMFQIKRDLEYYKDFCAEFGMRYDDYLQYAREFAEQLKKDFTYTMDETETLMLSVDSENLPIVFHTEYRKDTDFKSDTLVTGDMRAIGNQSVINIYCCMDKEEEIKQCINCRKEIRGEDTEPEDVLTTVQQDNFLTYIKNSKYAYYYPLFVFMLETALRVGEVCGLTWDDVDLEHGFVNITHQLQYTSAGKDACQYQILTPKSKSGIRNVPLSNAARDALMEQMQNQIEMDKKTKIEVDGYKDFVFSNRQNKPFITQTIGRILNRIVDDYNSDIKKFGGTIEPLPHIHPHLLRHTSCSRMAEAGVDPRTLQDIMGHASMKMTMELYNHVTDERLMNEIQKLNDRRIS